MMKREAFLLGMGLLLTAYGGYGLAQRLTLYYVASGSMEPYLPTGSLILVERGAVPAAGDIALVNYYGEPLVHRVVRVDPSSGIIWLTADAQPGFVQQAKLRDLIGVVVLALPYFGYMAMLARAYPWLTTAMLGALISLIILRWIKG